MGGLSREKILAALHAPPGPPLEVTAKFLRMHVADNEPDDIRRQIRHAAAPPALLLRRRLVALEALLAHPPPAETLITLVEDQGGKILHEPRAAEAMSYLKWLRELIREALMERGIDPDSID